MSLCLYFYREIKLVKPLKNPKVYEKENHCCYARRRDRKNST